MCYAVCFYWGPELVWRVGDTDRRLDIKVQSIWGSTFWMSKILILIFYFYWGPEPVRRVGDAEPVRRHPVWPVCRPHRRPGPYTLRQYRHRRRHLWGITAWNFNTGYSLILRLHVHPFRSSLRQCCRSGMFIPDPDFCPSRIPNLGSQIPDPRSKNSNKREGWKKFCCPTFFCSQKKHKIENYINFELVVKKKTLGQFTKNYRTFYPNNCH